MMRLPKIVVSLLITVNVGVSAQAQVASEPEELARVEKLFPDQVVRVIPQRSDGAPAASGFGLIVGERAGRIYIATPRHVVFGRDSPSSLSASPGVIFRADRLATIRARRLEMSSPRDDLAIIEVAAPPGLTPPKAPFVLAASLLRATRVWNIGIGQTWDLPDRAGGLGPEDSITKLRRVSGLRTPPGASGGAGVTASGIIGIVLQDAADYSLLLPIERIQELFKGWGAPINLLTSQAEQPPTGEIVSFQFRDSFGNVFVKRDLQFPQHLIATTDYNSEQITYAPRQPAHFHGCKGAIVGAVNRRRPLPGPGAVPVDMGRAAPERFFMPDADCRRMSIGIPETGALIEMTNIVRR